MGNGYCVTRASCRNVSGAGSWRLFSSAREMERTDSGLDVCRGERGSHDSTRPAAMHPAATASCNDTVPVAAGLRGARLRRWRAVIAVIAVVAAIDAAMHPDA